MDLANLKQAMSAVGALAIGSGIATLYGFISIIMVGVFAYNVNNGTIPVTSGANTTIQSTATTMITAVVTILSLVTLISGLASLVIVVLALLGRVDFTKSVGSGGGSKKAF